MSFNGYAAADRNYEPAYSELALLFVIVAYLFLILVFIYRPHVLTPRSGRHIRESGA